MKMHEDEYKKGYEVEDIPTSTLELSSRLEKEVDEIREILGIGIRTAKGDKRPVPEKMIPHLKDSLQVVLSGLEDIRIELEQL